MRRFRLLVHTTGLALILVLAAVSHVDYGSAALDLSRPAAGVPDRSGESAALDLGWEPVSASTGGQLGLVFHDPADAPATGASEPATESGTLDLSRTPAVTQSPDTGSGGLDLSRESASASAAVSAFSSGGGTLIGPQFHDPAEESAAASSARTGTAAQFYNNTVDSLISERRASILSLRQRNTDTIGWLTVPGTSIDEVVLKNPTAANNNYYLNLNIDKQYDRNGTICADRRATFGGGTREELSRNIALYAHSWNDDPNGARFSQLKRFRDADFAREHPYIYFSTSGEDMVWEVFAVFEAVTELPYINPSLPASQFAEMLDLALEASLFNYDVAVDPLDKVLTLSTCIYNVQGQSNLPYPNNYRFVVMARLVEPGARQKTSAVFAVNPNPLSPDDMLRRISGGAIRQFAQYIDVFGA